MEISAIGTTKEAGLRTIVVALDADVESLRALDWVQHEFYKPGDILHMVHVCRCMSSPLEVFHGVPGTTLHVADPSPHNESRELASAREFFMGRVEDKLQKAGIPWELHLFADTVNSGAADIATIILKVAQKVDAVIVVLARHDKPKQGWFGPGSVAKVCEALPLPVYIVP